MASMKWNLFLDDERGIPVCLLDRNFIVIRTVEEAIDWTKEYGYPTEAWLDHDLGFNAPGGDAINYLIWIIDQVLDNQTQYGDCSSMSVLVHSHNPVGAKRMADLWEGFIASEYGKIVTVPRIPYNGFMQYTKSIHSD